MREIIGRDGELAALEAFLDDVQGGCRALVLEGEAGIGKSTLWLAGVEHARARGCASSRRGRPRPSAGSRTSGWATCFEDVLDDVLPALSPPRRRALEVGAAPRGRAGRPRRPARARRSRCATRSQLLGEREPLLIAIDDVQWLDASSAGALAFALRRLDGEPRAPSARSPARSDGAQPSELERALGAERVERLPVGPLSVGALHRLLRDRLGRPFARQTLLRIHEQSGGNPFFALELARALDDGRRPARAAPGSARRSRSSCARGSPGCPAATRDALALAAALGHAFGVAPRAGGNRAQTRSSRRSPRT